MLTIKTQVVAGQLEDASVQNLLKGGGALDASSEKPKPVEWLPLGVWLNCIALARACKTFRDLPDSIVRNEALWKHWCPTPQTAPYAPHRPHSGSSGAATTRLSSQHPLHDLTPLNPHSLTLTFTPPRYDSDTPEDQKVPDFHERCSDFDRLLLVRCMREDRMLLSAQTYIANTLALPLTPTLTLTLPTDH